MHKINFATRVCGIFAVYAATVIALRAQTFTLLQSFSGTDGAYPGTQLIQGTDGTLYGTSGGYYGCSAGGNCGTIFRITTGGALTTLHSFCAESGCPDGANPAGALIQASDGNFYGTTASGGTGTFSCGTVFRITAAGTLTTFHSFNGTDGCGPYAGLIQATDGNLYGTTSSSGAFGWGTVFKIALSGSLTILHSFNYDDGSFPETALVQATDGNFYGATLGGPNGPGTIFRMASNGALTTLHSFNTSDGASPCCSWALIQATDGSLYGTTYAGGAYSGGTVFKISLDGSFTTLYNFCAESGCTDGQLPFAGLVQATDGNFYGAAALGGVYNDGSIFKLTAAGALTTAHSFDLGDGVSPDAAPIQSTNGQFYGTATDGGLYGYGTLFGLSTGLGPFVETEPAYGKVGDTIKILGTDLTGATSVTFNGTPAVFRVISHSLIEATVPAGATSGKVHVELPKVGLSTNVPFQVRR